MQRSFYYPIKKIYTPLPWLVLGAAAILGIAVSLLTLHSMSRSEEYAAKIMTEKGTSLTHTMQIFLHLNNQEGVKTGTEELAILQSAANKLVQQEGVLFIILTTTSGEIIVSANPDDIGFYLFAEQQMETFTKNTAASWHKVNLPDRGAFMVAQPFMDIPRKQIDTLGSTNSTQIDTTKIFIFIGLDPTTYDNILLQDQERDITLGQALLAIGLAGLFMIFIILAARTSRQALLDAQAFSLQVVSNLPEGLLVQNEHGELVMSNEVARDLLQLDLPEFQKKQAQTALPVLSTIVPQQLAAELEQAQQNNYFDDKEIEIDCVLSNGTSIPLGFRGVRIVSDDGNPAGTIIILRDLSAMRRLQEEVRRSEKLAAIGNLAAGVAHEVRNPLSSIKGYATHFGNLFPIDSENYRSARIMVDEVERLNRVITDLLSLARPSELCLLPLDPTSIIEKALRLIDKDTRTHNVRIRYKSTRHLAPLPFINIDQDRFLQALLNIFLNAIDAMPDGGTLDIELAPTETGGVRLSIKDTGIGMSPEIISKIFDPYFTTKRQGTGLGLAIVHKIIAAHGGRIFIYSEVNKGTETTIVLPSAFIEPGQKVLTHGETITYASGEKAEQ